MTRPNILHRTWYGANRFVGCHRRAGKRHLNHILRGLAPHPYFAASRATLYIEGNL